MAVLYAAYHFAETLGVRFYLHGDVLPDRRIPFVLPDLDETHTPLFETRGILPFHDFTEGPDWWEADDYKAYLTQMVKMRMNLLNLHCYPDGEAGPEPLVWIGHPDDVDAQGKVAFSPPSRWASTNYHSWGYAPMATGGFAAGAARLFEEDDFGPSVTRGHRPEPANPSASNEVFERAAGMLRDAFGYGRRLGVGICLGTETPLTIPRAVQARLREKGLESGEPGSSAKGIRGHVCPDRTRLSDRPLLAMDARSMDLAGRDPARDRRHRGRHQNRDGRIESTGESLRIWHQRLGAWAQAGSRVVR